MHTKFQAAEPSNSGEDDFYVHFPANPGPLQAKVKDY